MIRKRWAVLVLAVAIALVLGGATTLVFAGNGVVLTGQANDLAVVKVASSVDQVQTDSSSFVDVPGAVRRATSTGTGNLFVATFSGQGLCEDEFCRVRIIVKDLAGSTVAVMNPADDEATFATSGQAAYSIQRWINNLASGTYDFQVQFRADGCCFDLHAWTLKLERYT